MTANEELIGTREVAEVLNMSVPSLRDYKKRGLIKVAAKRGNKDLYNRADVMRRYSIISERRREGFSLSQISSMLTKEPISPLGSQEPQAGMSGEERLRGFLAELYREASPEMKAYVDQLRKKWNIHISGAE